MIRPTPFLITMVLSMIIYYFIDTKYDFTHKVSSFIPMKPKWKPFLLMICTFLFIFIFGLIGIYLINISDLLYYLLCGIIAGIGISIATKLYQEIK